MRKCKNDIADWYDAKDGYSYSITEAYDLDTYCVRRNQSQILRITKQVDKDHTISYEFNLPSTASVRTVNKAIAYAIKTNKSFTDVLYELGEIELLKLVDSTTKQIEASKQILLETLANQEV